MQFSLLTPEEPIYTGEIELISGTSEEGSFGMLPRHLPALMHLRHAPLKIKEDGSEKWFAIYGGFLAKRRDETIQVLAPGAKAKETIDSEQARDKVKQAKQQLEDESLSEEQTQQWREQLQRARCDLAVMENE